MFLGPNGPATVRWNTFNLEGGNLIYSVAGPNSSGGFASGLPQKAPPNLLGETQQKCGSPTYSVAGWYGDNDLALTLPKGGSASGEKFFVEGLGKVLTTPPACAIMKG